MAQAEESQNSPMVPRSIFDGDLLDPDEREYFRFVDAAMKETESRMFSNSRPAHAVYIIFKFLSTAKEHVLICTGHLMRAFDGVLAYGDPLLGRAAARFLKRGGKLDILIRDDIDLPADQPLTNHPLLSSIESSESDGEGHLSVYRAPASAAEQ